MNHSLRTRVILLIVAAITTCLFLYFFIEINLNTRMYGAQVNKEILTSVKLSIEKVDRYTNAMEQKSADLARTGELFYKTKKSKPSVNIDADVQTFLTDSLAQFPEAVGGGLWYEQYRFASDTKYYGPYAFWSNDKVTFTWDLSTPKYDYPTQDWYTRALPQDWDRAIKRESDYYWTAPYYDEAGTFLLMITVDAFMRDEHGVIVGVSTADWSIENMLAFLRKSKITEDSGIFLVEGNSHIVMANTLDQESVMKNASMVPWMQLLISPEKGVIKEADVRVGVESYHSYYTLTDAGMLYGTLVPFHVMTDPADKLLKTSLILSTFFAILLITALYLILSTITNPIIDLMKGVTRVADGDLTSRLSVTSSDEIGQLAAAFNAMTEKLRDVYGHLDEKVKEKTIALTEQIKETESRAEELKKFKLAVENTSQHIIITDTKGDVLYANQGVTDTTGYSHDELIGSNPSMWGRQMPKEFYEKMWHIILVEKKTFSGEILNKRKNGEFYTVSALISPVLNNDGEVTFFIGLETDISKQKEYEMALANENENIEKQVIERTKELKIEQARLLSSINSLSLGFIIADKENNVVLKNKSMGDLFGVAEIDTLTIEYIAEHLNARIDLKKQIERCLSSNVSFEMKEIIFGERFLRGIIAPVFEKEINEMIGYVFLLEDVTEARVLERSRDEFFSIASHELRTPLTAIRGNASMLLEMYSDELTNPDMKEMLADIDLSSVRLISIVNDFLEVSRLEQGKMNMHKEVFDAATVVEKVAREMKEMVSEKGIALYCVPPIKSLPMVNADIARFEQVLVNLVGNSVKYTKEGSVKVILEQAGKFIKVSIVDTGIGISEQNQILLFRKFQQAGKSILARDVSQGTGLGLYICKIIVTAMGGEIGVEQSEIGKGSTFYFTVPIAE